MPRITKKQELVDTLEEHFILQDLIAHYQREYAQSFSQFAGIMRNADDRVSRGIRSSIVGSSLFFQQRYAAKLFSGFDMLRSSDVDTTFERNYSARVLAKWSDVVANKIRPYFMQPSDTSRVIYELSFDQTWTKPGDAPRTATIAEHYRATNPGVYSAEQMLVSELSLSIGDYADSEVFFIDARKVGDNMSLQIRADLIPMMALIDFDDEHLGNSSISFPTIDFIRDLKSDILSTIVSHPEIEQEMREMDASVSSGMRQELAVLPETFHLDNTVDKQASISISEEDIVDRDAVFVGVSSKPVREGHQQNAPELCSRHNSRKGDVTYNYSTYERGGMRDVHAENKPFSMVPKNFTIDDGRFQGIWKNTSNQYDSRTLTKEEGRLAYIWYWKHSATVDDIADFAEMNAVIRAEADMLRSFIIFTKAAYITFSPYALGVLL